MRARTWRQQENGLDVRTANLAQQIVKGENRSRDFEPWRRHNRMTPPAQTEPQRDQRNPQRAMSDTQSQPPTLYMNFLDL